MSPLSTGLRLLAALALLGLMVAFFYEPLGRAFARWSGKRVGIAGAAVASPSESSAPAAPPSFLLQVFSTPPHAQVAIDGKARGATPVVTNISCRTGQIVKVTVDLSGYPRWQRELPCLPGESAVLQVKLGGR